MSHARSSPLHAPDHPPSASAQSASAPGSRKIYDSLFSTLRLAALIEWETQAGDAVFFIYLENDENNALRFSHDFAVDFETKVI